ncbi:uncharacterized protein LOC132163923 [Corylus avellana]|uniref:uncharacterized protein LOC132163923 n=1 Tax=Corylus avellana TaxID=13451 RepID=UPI001E21D85F|nr:uncharacterized protein LOC132163923 [Corylus avellana]
MDTDICRWISESVMRNTAAQDHVIKKLLRALPVSGADSRFKKTAVLRTIQAEISDALLTETTLDNLEVMEELDRYDGAEISEALKAAYRAVAVECTVKYLAGSGDRHGKYFEAVKRVWRRRIGGLERSRRSELVTGELRRWGDDVEAAVWDAEVARRLLKVNTRNEALEAVRVYLGEAWVLMGPTFLQSAAAVAETDGVQRAGASAGDMAVKNAVNRFEEVAAKNTPNVGEFAVKKVNHVEEVAVNTPCVGAMHQVEGVAGNTPCVGAMHQVEEVAGNTSNLNQEVGELSGETANQVASNTPNVGQDVGVNSSRPELCKGEGRGLVALQSGSWDLIVRDRAAAGRVDEIQKGAELPRRKHAVWHKRSKGVKITDTEEMVIDASCSKYDSLPTSEVNKVQEALRSSSLELRAVVKDPLPDALRLADTVISNLASNKQHEPSVENQGGKDVDAPNPSVNTGGEPAQTNDSNRGNQSCSHQSNARRPSLMERNSTAHAYEWDDSIDDSPEGMTEDASRLHLPSRRRKLVSPLKKQEVTKFARRRQIKRWSLLEEDTLRTAVQKYGKGNWKLILNCFRDIFEERTEVDLKDKWRNMSRY